MNPNTNDFQIKKILYPELNKPPKTSIRKKIKQIKKIEQLNKIKKYIQSSLIGRIVNLIYIIYI
jgi:hypothetical protein